MPNNAPPFAYCVIVSKFIKSSIFIFDNISAILFMSIFLKMNLLVYVFKISYCSIIVSNYVIC